MALWSVSDQIRQDIGKLYNYREEHVMDAKKMFENLNESFIYMERYVNNGSPSGWTQKKSTSPETNPFSGEKRFELYEFDDSQLDSLVIGNPNPIFNNRNFCHPDSITYGSQVILQDGIKTKKSDVIVQPTSGGRTMFVDCDKVDGFIKLTYDTARIGRVDRQLRFEHCMSSYEVSNALKRAIDAGKFPSTYSILLEKTGKVTYIPIDNEHYYEWGVMLRENRAYPYSKDMVQLIPGFSLFGIDNYSDHTKNDEFLINQIIDLSGINPLKYLINVIQMTIDSWFTTALNCGFLLELHGQNCYYEINQNFIITRIVIKDMDSVDKDITTEKKLGLNSAWKSFPYECFYADEPEDHPWYYKIRASYMYDFKLGTYILLPLIETVCAKYHLNKDEIILQIKKYVKDCYIGKLPKGFFPEDGRWYDCDNSERKPGTRRVYYPHDNPMFR